MSIIIEHIKTHLASVSVNQIGSMLNLIQRLTLKASHGFEESLEQVLLDTLIRVLNHLVCGNSNLGLTVNQILLNLLRSAQSSFQSSTGRCLKKFASSLF